ncbi:ferric reductase-like transmembrane domain-containing protein [Ruegeria aquimaris]|uniref:Ferric reductase-like transmembrane domain-containing protein n=1 Tax=Ruegeria aquimaris TaxID=2984333 RepID=A0ABT3ARU4_9RHOB|nr:ferric reductase-like transmembrane domain-containing protein [Ruegeria sp. XHP0148]MCV2891403.1 ferric reductase-like transmembrane domain-containing protein [Ruegeria sp. XHP0148]
MSRARNNMIWAGLAFVVALPVALAATSPLLAWRQPIYIAAGFAGIAAMALMLVQPLLAAGYLPRLSMQRGRRIHRWVGGILVATVAVHVVGLWITSPPDVVDALLFRSPTPFSAWGVIAMWALMAVALVAVLRRPLRLRPRIWRMCHTSLGLLVVVSTVIHAVQIEGTMEPLSKLMLCALVLAAAQKAVASLGVWSKRSLPR